MEVGHIFVVILVLIAGIANAIMDLSAEDKFTSSWWNKSESWYYKWKNGDPEQGERFWLSSTVLVFLTDGWHLTQFIFHSSWQLAIAICTPHPLITFIVLKILFSATFELFYKQGKDL